MRNRTKAWIIFLMLGWAYPLYSVFCYLRNYVCDSLDIIEQYLDEMTNNSKTHNGV